MPSKAKVKKSKSAGAPDGGITRSGRAVRALERYGFDSESIPRPSEHNRKRSGVNIGLRFPLRKRKMRMLSPRRPRSYFRPKPTSIEELWRPCDIFRPQLARDSSSLTAPPWLKWILDPNTVPCLDGSDPLSFAHRKRFDKVFKQAQSICRIPPSIGRTQVELEDFVERFAALGVAKEYCDWYVELTESVPYKDFEDEDKHDDALEAEFQKRHFEDRLLPSAIRDRVPSATGRASHHSMTRYQWQYWIDMYLACG